MKQLLFFMAIAFAVACTKETGTINSTSIDNGRIRQGDTIVTWSDPVGTYPNTRHIKYIQWRITAYETYDGTRHTRFLVDPTTANIGDTTEIMKYGDGFQIGRGNQLDSALDWVTVISGSTVTKKIGQNKDKVVSNRKIRDRDGNISESFSLRIITTDKDTKSRTGNGYTIDSEGKWNSTILEPLISHKGYKYIVSGITQYTNGIDTETFYYGDGTEDNVAFIKVNNGPKVKITLPHKAPGGYTE